MGRLDGKIAIVTGAGSGIGRGIAKCFVEEGAQVVVADINFEAATEVATALSPVFNKFMAVPIKADVTSDASIQKLIDGALYTFGRVDILVNNAGMAGEIGDPFPRNSSENWLRVYETNTVATMRTVKALWDHFIDRKSGAIINIASIVAHWHGALKMKPAYNASKAGLVSLTKNLAIMLAPYGVRVNSISPGLLFTGFWQKLGKQLKELRPEEYPPGVETYDVFLKRVGELVPLGREQTPEDIGKAAVFLASDDAKNVTGVDLPVDGGVLAR